MSYIPEEMSLTREYISSTNTRERRGNHVYVIEQKLCNLSVPFNELSEFDKQCIDKAMVNYLVRLDVIN